MRFFYDKKCELAAEYDDGTRLTEKQLFAILNHNNRNTKCQTQKSLEMEQDQWEISLDKMGFAP